MSTTRDPYSTIGSPLLAGANLGRIVRRFEIGVPPYALVNTSQVQGLGPVGYEIPMKEVSSQASEVFPRRIEHLEECVGATDFLGSNTGVQSHPILSKEISLLLYYFCLGASLEGLSNFIPKVSFHRLGF